MAMDVTRAGRKRSQPVQNWPAPAYVPARVIEELPPEEQPYFLYCRGYSHRQIAGMLQISKTTVGARIRRVLAQLRPTDEERQDWMQESVDALNQVKAAAWYQFEQSGDPYLLAQITAAEERIAKLRGLIDSGKTKIEVSGPNGGSIPVEFSARAAFAAVTAGSTGDRPDAE